MHFQPWPFCGAILAILFVGSAALGQQAHVGIPLRTNNDGFFEQQGTSGWALRGNGWFARFGGGPAVPPFGGAAPGAGAAGGVGFGGGGINGGLGFMAGQGSQRSNVMQSGNLTLYNGAPGFLSDTSQSPFVTGFIPVVGQGKAPWRQQFEGDIPTQKRDKPPIPPSAAGDDTGRPAAARESDPGRISLAELEAKRAAEESSRREDATAQWTKAREARAAGKPSVARIYYQMALRRASGELKARIQNDYQSLEQR